MRWKLPLATLCLPLLLSGTAQAANFVVNRFDDPAPMAAPNGCNSGGSCSLREAVLAANTLSDVDTIQLSSGTYDLSIPEAGSPESGDLDVIYSVIIQGEGPGVTILNAVQPSLNDRILEISGPGGIFTLDGVTVQNGNAGGAPGGGIAQLSPNFFTTLSNCEIIQNRADSTGGGVYLNSAAVVENCRIDGNTLNAGSGGGLYFSSSAGLRFLNSSASGNTINNGGSGAGLFFSAGASLELSQAQFNGNTLSNGGTGGGVYATGGGPLIFTQVEASNNQLPDGGTGGGIFGSTSNIIATDMLVNGNTLGDGGSGGGIYLSGFSLDMSNLVLTGNTIDNGGSGAGAFLDFSNISLNNLEVSGNTVDSGGPGGGLYLSSGSLVLLNSDISANSAATGGGLYASSGSIDLVNLTVSENSSLAEGGGLYLSTGDAQLSNLTIVDNQSDLDNDTAGNGGGIFISGPVTLRNSILAQNSSNGGMGPDCFGALTSDGYNIIGVDTDCTITPPQGDPASTDSYGVDPLLGPLGNNGGPTQTRALLAGSPAIDGGNPAGCLDGSGNLVTTDQRGQIRPSGPRCDIGAFELGSSDLAIVKTASATQVAVGDQFSYTLEITNNGPGNNFEIAVSDAIPTGLSLVSASSDQADCSAAGNTVTCSLDELAVSESFTVEIVVTADQEGDAVNTATVQGSEADPDPANDSSSITVSVGPLNPDLSGGGCSLGAASQGLASWGSALWALGLAGAAWTQRRRLMKK